MSILRQLKEIFPTVSENWLRELCEPYSEEELDIEELIDMILNCRCLPQEEHLGHTGNIKKQGEKKDETTYFESGDDIYQEELFTIHYGEHFHTCEDDNTLIGSPIVAVNQLVQPEVPSIHSEACMFFSHKQDKTVCSDEICDIKQGSCNTATPPPSFENKCALPVSSDLKSKDDKLLIEEIKSEKSACHKHLQECDDSKPKSSSSVKAAMKLACGEASTMAGSSDPSSNTSTSTPEVLNHFSVMKLEPVSLLPSSQHDEPCCSKNAYQCQAFTSLDTHQCITNPPSLYKRGRLFKNKSKSACSGNPRSAQAVFRSSKIRNNEQRLRRLLLHQCRLSIQKNINKESSPHSVHFLSQFQKVINKFCLLFEIFKDADLKYLFAQCQLLTGQDDLLNFISRSLDNRDYPKALENSGSNFPALHKALEDADLEYLPDHSHISAGKDELLNFISQFLDNKNYSNAREDEQQATKQFLGTFECNIEDFLQAIPDPDEEFSRVNYDRTGYEDNADIYLRSRYPKLSHERIKEMLKINQLNLVAICQQLEAEGQEISPYILEHLKLHRKPTIFFHQEVWYIAHKTEIQNYLKSVIEAAKVDMELNRPPTPPPPIEEFECEMCCELVKDYSQLGSCDGPSGHLSCKSCIRRHIQIRHWDGATTFDCLAGCGALIPYQTIKEVLPAHEFEILERNIQEVEVRAAKIENLQECPFCPFKYVGDQNDDLIICENPPCMKKSCKICRKEDHLPDICEKLREKTEESARNYIANKMTEALVRQCYKCGKEFVKEANCNKMTCPCGAKMCYVCRQPVTDYSHFNGPGGDNYDRCQLFLDDEIVHDRPVEAAAQQALKDVIAKNPGINLDPNKIVPK